MNPEYLSAGRELDHRKKAVLVSAAFTMLLVPLAIGLLNVPIHAQAQAQSLQFEAASIKPNMSGALEVYVRPSPGRLSITNMTVKNLLTVAFGIRDFQVSGGPAWTESEKYDIDAKSEGNATPQEVTGPMLQSLLERRFKLSVHAELKELPVYLMTVVKPSASLKKSTDPTCTPYDPGTPPLPGAPSRNPNELCGSIGLGLTNLNATQATMAALTMALSHMLGRTVIDKTNLAGEFDARLTFAPIGFVPPGAPVDPTLPDIFTATQEQLGLKLESGRGPVQILVIDHVEKPDVN